MNDQTGLTEASIVVRSADQISATIDGEIALMSTADGSYYKMDATGSRIWELMEQPMRVADLVARLAGEFEVDGPSCTRDVLRYLDELRKAQLIVVADIAGGYPAA